jgi:Lrp/AsnC family transcriptional regulator, leucine-responsive regulatory protein
MTMVISTNNSQALDDKDRRIVALVQRDGKLAQAEIAKRVGLSTAAINERLKKLEHSGVIRRYVAVVDPKAVGTSVMAFVEVFIEHPRFEREFIDGLRALDEVQECHHITGEFSLLLKVRVRDMEALQQLLIHRINALEGVRQTRTVIVLSTSKEESYVPTGGEGEMP